MFNLASKRRPYSPGKWVVRNYPGYHTRKLGGPWREWRHRMRGLRMFYEWKLTDPKLRDRPSPVNK